jgi:hypothetical protein
MSSTTLRRSRRGSLVVSTTLRRSRRRSLIVSATLRGSRRRAVSSKELLQSRSRGRPVNGLVAAKQIARSLGDARLSTLLFLVVVAHGRCGSRRGRKRRRPWAGRRLWRNGWSIQRTRRARCRGRHRLVGEDILRDGGDERVLLPFGEGFVPIDVSQVSGRSLVVGHDEPSRPRARRASRYEVDNT